MNRVSPAATASYQIARFCNTFRAADLSETALHTVRRACLDTIGGAIGAIDEPAVQLALAHTAGHSGPENASVWLTGEPLPVELAAFVNGIASHVLDFDDITVIMRGHPSVALLPAIIALAETIDADFPALAAAYVVGFEVACKLGRAYGIQHYPRGWHYTSSIGVIAGAAACSHLLGLSEEQTVNAIGLAVSQASGVRENFGSMTKSFHPGHCGAATVRSVLLARRGFTASPTALDGPAGYAVLYAEGADLSTELAQLGTTPLEIEQGGIDIKQYPICGATHRPLDGLFDLREEYGLELSQVEQIVVTGVRGGFTPLVQDRPTTGLAGKFSMQYAMAAGLADGEITLSSFTDAKVMRPEIQAFLPNVTKIEQEGMLSPRWVHLDVRLRDGRQLEKRVNSLRGSAEHPLTDDALTRKVIGCCRFAGTGVDGEHLSEAWLGASGSDSVRALMKIAYPSSEREAVRA